MLTRRHIQNVADLPFAEMDMRRISRHRRFHIDALAIDDQMVMALGGIIDRITCRINHFTLDNKGNLEPVGDGGTVAQVTKADTRPSSSKGVAYRLLLLD